MFGWIRRMFDAASGAVDNTVRSWVHDLVNGLYGFLHMIFGDVGRGWDDFAGIVESNWHRVDRFARTTALAFWHVFKVAIPRVLAEARKLFGQVEKFAKGVYDYAVKQFAHVVGLIESSIKSLWHQVIQDVWNPLVADFTKAWHWITNEGATVFYYITHPGKLIDLVWVSLLAKLEQQAWIAGELLGKFFLSLIIRNLTRFVSLIEDILDAVL